MMRNRKKQTGQSVLEYTLLTIFVLGAFLVFQKYIVRAFSGRWKASAESFGFGRQYDPNTTKECALYKGAWYDVGCFDTTCTEECLSSATKSDADCQTCVTGCARDYCDDT